jgi:hypothetical protein
VNTSGSEQTLSGLQSLVRTSTAATQRQVGRAAHRVPRVAAETGASRRGALAAAVESHPVLATNIGMVAIVAGMSFLVMILPFGEPMNVLLSAAVVVALAMACSQAWRASGAERPSSPCAPTSSAREADSDAS